MENFLNDLADDIQNYKTKADRITNSIIKVIRSYEKYINALKITINHQEKQIKKLTEKINNIKENQNND